MGEPELRPGPPWVMAEMMALQPGLAPALLGASDPALDALAGAVQAGGTVTVTGCGTSEHGAHGIAALLRAALPEAERARVRALPALAAATEPVGGLCLAVSHDGGTRATLLALEAAARAGAVTAALTAAPDAAIAGAAEVVVVTPAADRSWCHTVAYTSALLAGAAVAARLGLSGVEGDAARALLAAGVGVEAGADAGAAAVRPGADAEQAAAVLADRRVVLCAGAGPDHVTARELALKLAEGARLATLALELETVLHGQLAGHDAADGLVLVAPDGDERLERRAGHVAGAAAAIGLPVVVLGTPPAGVEPAATVPIPDAPGLHPVLRALLGGAAALQTLTLALAHARGVNPDLIRREQPPYRAAAAVAEEGAPW